MVHALNNGEDKARAFFVIRELGVTKRRPVSHAGGVARGIIKRDTFLE